MLIGGLLIIAGIITTVALAVGFLGGFVPTASQLAPGGYLNETLELRAGQGYNYIVSIQDFALTDRLSVVLLSPSGVEVNRTLVASSAPLVVTEIANEDGTYMLSVQNIGPREVTVLHGFSRIDVSQAVMVGIGVMIGFIGLILLIVGLVLWVLDRRKTRQSV